MRKTSFPRFRRSGLLWRQHLGKAAGRRKTRANRTTTRRESMSIQMNRRNFLKASLAAGIGAASISAKTRIDFFIRKKPPWIHLIFPDGKKISNLCSNIVTVSSSFVKHFNACKSAFLSFYMFIFRGTALRRDAFCQQDAKNRAQGLSSRPAGGILCALLIKKYFTAIRNKNRRCRWGLAPSPPRTPGDDRADGPASIFFR